MIQLGSVLFAFSLATSAGAVLSAIIGLRVRRESWLILSRQLTYLHFWVITGAVVILLALLGKADFSAIYVAENVNLALPLFYRFTSLWAGQAGSMLWWNFLLVLFSAIAIRNMEKRELSLVPYMIIILMFTSFFFSALGNFSPTSDPFRLITAGGQPFAQADGRGLNPLLQHWAMIIHPPILYLGYVSFSVPYAIAMAALIRGQVNLEWTQLIRRWTIFSWFFLGTGILLGGKWAYEELGWGGYWAWDPVENASLMPWLTGTAFLHSIIVQERRGMLKVWNMVLVSLSFVMTIFGTFLTRSGVVNSVHAFASSNLGPFFAAFMVLTIFFSTWFIVLRLPILKSDRPFNSFLSREAGFLFNNVILVIALFAVIWGTMFPAISEAVTGTRVSVTATWFNKWMVPLGLMILFLTGAGPLLAWRTTAKATLVKNFRLPIAMFLLVGCTFTAIRYLETGSFDSEAMQPLAGLTFALSAFVITGVVEEFIRATRNRVQYTRENPLAAFVLILFQNKRRYLGYMVHIGLAILFAGFAGKAFSTETKMELSVGEAKTFDGYTIHVSGYETKRVPATGPMLYTTQIVTITAYKNNELVGRDTTEIRQYPMFSFQTGGFTDPPQTTSEPAILSGILTDVYVQLGGVNDDGRLVIQVWINPLVFWVWFGFGFFVIASLFLLLPVGEKNKIHLFGKEFSIQPLPAT